MVQNVNRRVPGGRHDLQLHHAPRCYGQLGCCDLLSAHRSWSDQSDRRSSSDRPLQSDLLRSAPRQRSGVLQSARAQDHLLCDRHLLHVLHHGFRWLHPALCHGKHPLRVLMFCESA